MYSIVRIYCIYLFICGWTNCFYFLVTVNHILSTQMYKYLFLSLFSILLGIISQVELLGHMVNLGNSDTVLQHGQNLRTLC